MKNKINFTGDYSFTNKNYSIVIEKNNSFDVAEINKVLELYNKDKILSVHSFFKEFFSALNYDSKVGADLLSVKMKSNYFNYLKLKLKEIDIFLCEYFKTTFLERSIFLKNIKPLFMNEKELQIPVYNHGTKTGRSRIISGTNYLTMKKEKRGMLKTSKDRNLYELDFSSCEPMFYFQFLGYDFKKIDMYEKIKNDLNIKVDRSKLKLTIISILYGAGYETVKRNAKITSSEYKKIKDYMKIDDFIKKIKFENDTMFNFYGRPLIGTNKQNMVNYWVQSSAADYVYLAFKKYANDFKTFNLHAVIHDAMLFSTLKQEHDLVINTISLSEPISNFKIPVKIHQYSDN